MPVNCEPADSLINRSRYIIMKAQLALALSCSGNGAGEDTADTLSEAQELGEKIISGMHRAKKSDIPALLECYSLLIRTVLQQTPDMDFISRQEESLISAWETGGSDIAESDIFRILSKPGANGETKTRRDRLHGSILKKWIDALEKYGKFPEATTSETYSRLALLMSADIDGYVTDAEEAKRRWYDSNKETEPERLGTTILETYRQYIASLPSQILDFENRLTLDNQILTILLSRKDLPSSTRSLHLLSLRYNALLLD